jgi:cobalt/nickel transport protein
MENKKKHSGLVRNIILIAIVIGLAALPLFLNKAENFQGTDDKAAKAVTEANPDYKPWFNFIFKPSGEVATFFFALQAAAGAGVVGYYIGYMRGRSKGRSEFKNDLP